MGLYVNSFSTAMLHFQLPGPLEVVHRRHSQHNLVDEGGQPLHSTWRPVMMGPLRSTWGEYIHPPVIGSAFCRATAQQKYNETVS